MLFLLLLPTKLRIWEVGLLVLSKIRDVSSVGLVRQLADDKQEAVGSS